MQRSCGLFPAPFPQDSEDLERITKLFHFLGVFLAKCIQDNRLVDLPVSQPFFKLLCLGDIKSNMSKLLYQSRSSAPLPGHDTDRLHPHSFLLLSEVQSEASTEESQETFSVGSFDEDSKSEFILDPPKPKPPAWYHGILTWDDFQLVNPHRSDDTHVILCISHLQLLDFICLNGVCRGVCVCVCVHAGRAS